MNSYVIFSLLLAAMIISPVAHAQIWDMMTNPKVATVLVHPPGLGIQVNKIAFGSATGEGSGEFVDALTEHFVRANVEVIERQRLQALLREHDFSLSGYVDRQSASEIGKIVGPAVMLFVNMQRRATEQKQVYNDWKDSKGNVHRTWTSRTQAFIRGSVRSVDLATGRVFAATVLEAKPVFENKVDGRCCAEYPSEFDALDAGTREVVGQAVRLFLPWNETVELYYFDDKTCGLKGAYSMHKAGNIGGALEQSLRNLEQCRSMPKADAKVIAHANHNVGMGYFSLGMEDKALEYLQEAQRIKPGQIYAEAIIQCQKSSAYARDMQRIEERMVLDAAAVDQKNAEATKAKDAETVTNADILNLVKAKLPGVVIIAKIKSSQCRFDLGAAALIQLKQGGVPDDVLVAMMECGKK
ncbi:MAG: hypothetical protein IMZ55_10325 [Acidobacteria bacterium]|nr:hypothetical protein [Acidobacteriota bacterium]